MIIDLNDSRAHELRQQAWVLYAEGKYTEAADVYDVEADEWEEIGRPDIGKFARNDALRCRAEARGFVLRPSHPISTVQK